MRHIRFAAFLFPFALAGCGLLSDQTVRLLTDRPEMAAYVERYNARTFLGRMANDTDLKGAVVFLGCSHAGVANTVGHALSLSRTGRLRALVGGMHLAQAPIARVEGLADLLEGLAPRAVGPSHCTGRGAAAYLRSRLPAAFVAVRAGTILTSHHAL